MSEPKLLKDVPLSQRIITDESKFTEEIPLAQVIACSCGHEAFSLDVVEDYVYLRLYYNQRALHRTVFERIRNAWYMLIGKEYKVVELVFPIGEIKKQFEEFLSKLH